MNPFASLSPVKDLQYFLWLEIVQSYPMDTTGSLPSGKAAGA
jgi:hypothetical protein